MKCSFIVFFWIFCDFASSRYHHFQANQRINQCQCVPREKCEDYDDEAALFGHGLLDPRINSRKCPHSGDICCSTLTTSTPLTSCGRPSINPTKSRITTSTTATFGELPWNLIIQEGGGGDKEKNLYKCGASLIHPRVALTAAHCVQPYIESPEKLLVRAGEYDIDSRHEPLPFQDNYVEEILIHEEYNPASLKNDIAILILGESFAMTGNVGVVCLPTPDVKIVESRCVASGWGKNSYNKGKYSTVLKKVQIPLMERGHCLETLRKTRLGGRYNLHKSFICAGGKKGQDSCKGDGGSPLICPVWDDETRWVQMGIVSWGIGCGLDGVPGVYVNVPLYWDWIEYEMQFRDLDAMAYKL